MGQKTQKKQKKRDSCRYDAETIIGDARDALLNDSISSEHRPAGTQALQVHPRCLADHNLKAPPALAFAPALAPAAKHAEAR